MGDVIDALEGFLGTDSTGPFSPNEEQVKSIESCVGWFNGSSWAKRRAWLIRAFVPLSVLLLAVALFVPSGFASKVQWTGGVLGFVILTPLMYLLISGTTQRTYLMLKVRELVFGSRFIDWLTWIVGAALVFGVLVALDWHLMWLGLAIAAAIVASAFHFLVDPMVSRQRVDPVMQAEALLKKMRLRAVPEAALQQFVCKYAGEHWEAFYEELFGYESKMLAREKWGKGSAIGAKGGASKGDKGRPRPKYAAWRDPIIAWIDDKQKARREAKERKHIAKLELASLKAKGYSDTAARKKAERVAETLVMKAAEMREDAKAAAMETTPPPAKPDEKKDEKPQEQAATEEAAKKRKKMLDDEGLEGFEHLSYFQRRYGGWAGLFLGPSVRFLLGAVLLTGCILWVKQNKIIPGERLATLGATVKDQSSDIVGGVDATKISGAAQNVVDTSVESKPLDLPMIPSFATRLFDGWAPGIAGAMLVISALFSGPSLGIFLVPAALIMFLGGKYGMPALGPASSQSVATAAGLVLAAIGFMFARK
jgi:membrane protein implicated in regulation of membrane protease activity